MKWISNECELMIIIIINNDSNINNNINESNW